MSCDCELVDTYRSDRVSNKRDGISDCVEDMQFDVFALNGMHRFKRFADIIFQFETCALTHDIGLVFAAR